MADFLQRLTAVRALLLGGLLLWLAPGAHPLLAQYEGADFSHRKHLVMVATCAECHSGAQTSRLASDNLLPTASVCGKCHAPASVKEPRESLVTKFNHQLHASIPGVGGVIAAAVRSEGYLGEVSEGFAGRLDSADRCTACHRGLATSDKVTAAVFPAMADCLVCHSEVDAPFSCEKCHDEGPHLMPATHNAQYLESHSRPGGLRDRASCVPCHGRGFTCMGCH